MEYLTREDIDDLKKASTFEELTIVAFRVLKRMPKPIVMVSGPISKTGGLGNVEANIEVFNRTIQELSAKGLNVFNQIPFEEHIWRVMETPYYRGGTHLLEMFYFPIFVSGVVEEIYFILGWATSFGAGWEHNCARKIGIKVTYLK